MHTQLVQQLDLRTTKRVIVLSVTSIGNPIDRFFKNRGITDPLEQITFPYLTTLKIVFSLLLPKLITNLSIIAFDIPIAFMG